MLTCNINLLVCFKISYVSRYLKVLKLKSLGAIYLEHDLHGESLLMFVVHALQSAAQHSLLKMNWDRAIPETTITSFTRQTSVLS